MKTFSQLIESINEAWPGTKEYEAKYGKPKGMTGGKTEFRGNRHDVTVKDGVTKAVRRTDSTGDTAEPDKKVEIQDGPKRGRGRPPGKYGSYKKKVKESIEIIESLSSNEEIEEFLESLDEESYDELMEFLDYLEEEQIDELSKNTLTSYAKKAKEQGKTARYYGNYGDQDDDQETKDKYHDKADKRFAGAKKALSKASEKSLKEMIEDLDEEQLHYFLSSLDEEELQAISTSLDEEELNELSNKTLSSYAKKARDRAEIHTDKAEFHSRLAQNSKERGLRMYKSDKENTDYHVGKAIKRLKGLEKANARLTKEDVDLEPHPVKISESLSVESLAAFITKSKE